MKQEVIGLIGGTIGTSVSATGTAIQPNEILQTISLIITILGGIITIVFALLGWWQRAKQDGKIDKEEVKELIDIVQDGTENIKESLDDKKKGDKQ